MNLTFSEWHRCQFFRCPLYILYTDVELQRGNPMD
jgi:hypothetical protein